MPDHLRHARAGVGAVGNATVRKRPTLARQGGTLRPRTSIGRCLETRDAARTRTRTFRPAHSARGPGDSRVWRGPPANRRDDPQRFSRRRARGSEPERSTLLHAATGQHNSMPPEPTPRTPHAARPEARALEGRNRPAG